MQSLVVALKIANSVTAPISLRRHLFCSQFEDNELGYEDLARFCRVSFLEKFLNLLPEIIAFLDTIGERYEQLDKKLPFLTDFMSHYNSVNLQSQGNGKNIIELFS